MRRGAVLILTLSAALVTALVAALRAGVMPLGVRGEWEWLPVLFPANPRDIGLAVAAVAVYAGFVGRVRAALDGRVTRWKESVAVLALLAASITTQAVVPCGAPVGYGLAKWAIVLHEKGSTGYFLVARNEVHDLRRFLAEYPRWIARRDALHIGTHPPGLIVVEAVLLRFFQGAPAASRIVESYTPESVALAFRLFDGPSPLSHADRATIAVTGMLTLFCCAATVVPLYLLARASLPAPSAWTTAALWPLVPSAVLFQPTADTAFPLLSASALALAAHSGRLSRRGGGLASVVGGMVLGVAMQFTLGFLAVGLVVAIILGTARGKSRDERLALIAATGIGFVSLTALVWVSTTANPFETWWWNLINHARFYDQFPRSYLPWAVANPVELAVGLGLPVAVWTVVGLVSGRGAPTVGPASAVVLVLLTISGKNLSEVGRLWLPMMPALLVAAGHGFNRLHAGPKSLAATTALLGAQTLALQATIQVVYPF